MTLVASQDLRTCLQTSQTSSAHTSRTVSQTGIQDLPHAFTPGMAQCTFDQGKVCALRNDLSTLPPCGGNTERPDFLLLAANRLQVNARPAGSHSSTCDKAEKHQPEGDR